MSAWAGEGPVVIIEVERWGEFLRLHMDRDFVGHNVAFDVAVIRSSLESCLWTRDLAKEWIGLVEKGQVYCTLLLDILVRLAAGEIPPGDGGGYQGLERNLERVTAAYQIDCPSVDKKSTYRTRFGELLDEPDWTAVDRGFFDYSALDTRAAYLLAVKLLEIGWRHHNRIDKEKLHPDADKWGPLTTRLQVMGAVALADVSRRGIGIDLDAFWRLEAKLRNDYQGHITWIELNHPQIIKHETVKPIKVRKVKRKKGAGPQQQDLFVIEEATAPVPSGGKRTGRRETTKKTGLAMMDRKCLSLVLGEVVEELGAEKPRTPKGLMSLKEEDWVAYEDRNEFVRHWLAAQNLGKLISFTSQALDKGAEESRLRTRYMPLVKTGRTSARDPNIQQIPRNGGFRSHFVAAPGRLLYTVDISAAELRTLAHLCEKWFGKSVLGQTIRAKKDPHCYTASLLLGVPYDEVRLGVKAEKALPDDADKPLSRARQAAKALNFGVPGGLGKVRLVGYAKANYGVTMTEDEAETFKDKLVTEIFPELNGESGWLSARGMERLATNLCLPFDTVFDAVTDVAPKTGMVTTCLEKVLEGCTVRRDGVAYQPQWVDKLWKLALRLAADSPTAYPHLEAIRSRRASSELKDLFFLDYALSPTGRIRTDVIFTEAHNSPFQSLAADLAKLSLWELYKNDYQVVAFIHDEFVIELDEDTAEQEAKKIDRILIDCMQHVLEGFPVEVEGHLGKCWKK